MSIAHKLSLLKIVDGVIVIESTDYCNKIIKVNHGDWFSGTLYKYLQDVEDLFGVVIIKKIYPSKKSKGGRPKKIALLTKMQVKAFMLFSRNNKKNKIDKLELLQAFSEKEKEIKGIKRNAEDLPGYPYTCEKLWLDSGIATKTYVRNSIYRDFEEGKDYYKKGNALKITESCYLSLLTSFRSKNGAKVNVNSKIKNISFEMKIDENIGLEGNTRLPKQNL